jgi:hypothetical protein
MIESALVRIKYKPGEKSVMHTHPESVAVFLTDAQSKFTYPDGKSEDIGKLHERYEMKSCCTMASVQLLPRVHHISRPITRWLSVLREVSTWQE